MTKISVLVSARRNSKYLAKFISGYQLRTSEMADIELLVMLNANDTWNNELVGVLERMQSAMFELVGIHEPEQYPMRFYRENMQLGRAGLHRYFNELVQHATGDWIVYFCEDHFITMQDWDRHVMRMINGKLPDGDCEGKQFPLDSNEPWVLVPKFDNCGAMNHIVSKGFIKALGGQIGKHGWIDSYINDVLALVPERRIRFDDEMFHDFTHDQPNPMSEAHMQAVSTKKGDHMRKYDDFVVQELIKDDAAQIKKAVAKGR
jgi:hypothetical protein